MTLKRVVTLRHVESGRVLPLEKPTVIGRSSVFYRYVAGDERGDRLTEGALSTLAALDYVSIDRDIYISRIHGLIDPEGPLLADLNSSNGTRRNGRPVECFATLGVGSALDAGDVLTVGDQHFEVLVERIGWEDHVARIHARRHALLVTDGHLQRRVSAERLGAHLTERKGVDARYATFGVDTDRGLEDLAARASDEGITIVAILGPVAAENVLVRGGRLRFDKVVHTVAQLPGRKLILLEADGDPSACEAIFADLASHDMVLISSGANVDLEEHLTPSTIVASTIDEMRLSVGGGEPGFHGAFDSTVDGIEATIGAETNDLDFAWLADYTGRLAVTFGRRSWEPASAVCPSIRGLDDATPPRGVIRRR